MESKSFLTNIIRQYDFNLAYAKELVRDLDEMQMTEIPAEGLVNHPAFTLGHLISGSAMMAEDLGDTFEIPQGWKELFLRKGPGDPAMPEKDISKFPAKKDLLAELEKQHNKVKAILHTKSTEELNEAISWRFKSMMPSLLDLTVFMCINHEAMHLGQLAAWRRAMKLPSALGRM